MNTITINDVVEKYKDYGIKPYIYVKGAEKIAPYQLLNDMKYGIFAGKSFRWFSVNDIFNKIYFELYETADSVLKLMEQEPFDIDTILHNLPYCGHVLLKRKGNSNTIRKIFKASLFHAGKEITVYNETILDESGDAIPYSLEEMHDRYNDGSLYEVVHE